MNKYMERLTNKLIGTQTDKYICQKYGQIHRCKDKQIDRKTVVLISIWEYENIYRQTSGQIGRFKAI